MKWVGYHLQLKVPKKSTEWQVTSVYSSEKWRQYLLLVQMTVGHSNQKYIGSIMSTLKILNEIVIFQKLNKTHPCVFLQVHKENTFVKCLCIWMLLNWLYWPSMSTSYFVGKAFSFLWKIAPYVPFCHLNIIDSALVVWWHMTPGLSW